MLLHSASEIIESVAAQLLETEGPIAVMAGHFALVERRNNGTLVPGVTQDIDDPILRRLVANHPYMGDFPVETWLVGIEVVRCLHAVGHAAKLLVLVNDWQHVSPVRSGERHSARDAFFANARLPKVFCDALRAHGLDETVLVTDVRDGKPCIFWSESGLRARYNRNFRTKVPIESACAQEWVPLLARLEELRFGGLVAFMPNSCRLPITSGTELANEYLELNIKTVNSFPSGTTDDFWANTWLES